MSDDISYLVPDDDSPLNKLLREANGKVAHWWIEDDLIPYTEYDRRRDAVSYWRERYWRSVSRW